MIVLPVWLFAWAAAPLSAAAACAMSDCCRSGHCAMCAKGMCGMTSHRQSGMHAMCARSAGGGCAVCSTSDRTDASKVLDVSLQPAVLARPAAWVRSFRSTRLVTLLARALPSAPAAAPWEPPRS